MRVLISGGGIAGLTLAYWLHNYDIPAVVLEQAPAIRRDGYAIDFLGTGYEVAEHMGLIDRLAAHQVPFDAVLYVNKDGKPVARMDVALMRSLSAGKYLGLMHATLEEALYDALAGQVEVRFGRSLTHLVPGLDAVVATFNDGTSESFDLLIGADGVHSATRALVFGPADRFSHYLGTRAGGYAKTAPTSGPMSSSPRSTTRTAACAALPKSRAMTPPGCRPPRPPPISTAAPPRSGACASWKTS
jgi:2-polyprenyl-6-methoxyphenol hydroxylase-like FAD-dependent oxidoreductase